MKNPNVLFVLTILCAFLTTLLSQVFLGGIGYKKIGEQETAISSHTEKEEEKIDTSSLKDISASVKSVAKKLSPSVVSIIVSKDIQTYRTDPFGFFYEPSGTVRKKVGGGTGFFITKE